MRSAFFSFQLHILSAFGKNEKETEDVTMKKTTWYVITLLLATLLLAALPVSGEEQIYEDVIRLHVLAESDSEEDQALKLLVRDRILAEYGTHLSGFSDVEQAEKEAQKLLDRIQATAQGVVNEAGCAYPVSVTFGEENYPARDYGEYSFPAGRYLSLRVLIGSGEGQNWWCVLFPPLCLDLATGNAPEDDALAVGLTPEEYRLITGNAEGGYRIRFKTLELLQEAFGRRR